MKTLLAPAARLMGQLRLLPKFLLVSLLFLIPLVLVSTLLFGELQKSIGQASLERDGLRAASAIDALRQDLQRHQMLNFMALSGNAKAATRASQQQQAVTRQLDALAQQQALFEQTGLAAIPARLRQQWQTLATQRGQKAKEDFAAHTALLRQIQQLKDDVSNRSSLRLDPQIDTHYLSLALLDNLPEVGDNIAAISARGAAYIDTGLLEANEDVMLAAIVASGRLALTQLGDKLQALVAGQPDWQARLAPAQAALAPAHAFFERATNEVLKSVDQTSGDQFADAGLQAMAKLQQGAGAATTLLDAQLQARVDSYTWRRNVILAVVLAVLILAAWLLAGFYAATRQQLHALQRAVQSTASGDLRSQNTARGKDEISILATNFGGMNQSLSQLIARVRNSADVIATASSEIAVGNGDLSRRTESQAASLQMTSASMEALAGEVRSNAGNAEQANTLARSAARFAQRGGEVVHDIVDTMASITHSSSQIMGIIGVIDSIAFQTNILALNAAVEAARAGEQGRGFAVVASEVRVLAQRSAAAAREIKQLINDSASKVELGEQKVQGAGQSMGDIARSINEVVDIMDRIAASSQKQSSGISEVAGALGDIDSMTQENAALVEQAAAAAESLQQQAHLLADSVSVFKIVDAVPSSVTALGYSTPQALRRLAA